MAKMLDRVLSRMPSGKDKGKDEKSEPHTLCIRTGDNRRGEVEAASPRGKKRAASEDLEAEMPKLGKRDPQGSLPRQAPSPHHALQLANHPTSRKSIINLKVLYFSWINDQDSTLCSPAGSYSQQGSSFGDLPPEMMESETPLAYTVLDAGDTEVSSWRSPDPPR